MVSCLADSPKNAITFLSCLNIRLSGVFAGIISDEFLLKSAKKWLELLI
jgi:hypothetical protein